MRKMLNILLLICMVSAIAGTSYGQELVTATLVQQQQTAPVTVGDVVTLDLTVTHPANWRVVLPELASTWGDVEVVSQATPQINANADGTETTSQQIDVAMFAPGEYRTQPLTMTVVDSNGQTEVAIANPVSLVVDSVLVDGDTTLRDIKPLASFAQAVDNPTGIIIGGLALIVIAVWTVALYLQRRPAKTPVDLRTPREKALDRLKEIAAANLLAQGNAKEYYAQLSMCLRTYLEAELGVKAVEQTTSEITESLKTRGAEVEFTFGVQSALRTCDMLVYATTDPDERDARPLSALVHSLITASPLPVTEEPASSNVAQEVTN